MSSQNEPPPPNPILTAYETFVRDTPLVTRYTITIQFVSWFASFFVDPSFAIGNIPYFTIFKFELYRIVLSPLICQSLLSLVFVYISFVDHGKRLEFSMGSTAFAWLMLSLAVSTNVVFLFICFTLYGLGGDERFLHMHSSGIWTILFGLIAIECSKAPTGSKRRLFFCEIPTLYYPLGLLAIFSMFAGFLMAFYISAGVGYAYGRGYFDRFKMPESRFKQWEDTILANFVRREGWVAGHAATGSDAWNNSSSGGYSMFQRPVGRAGAGGLASPGVVNAPPEAAQPAGFPKVGGRTLGGPTRRPPTAEARAAMLEAAAARRAAEENV